MKKLKNIILVLIAFYFCGKAFACSIFYYIDKKTGKIYFINNEDFYYDDVKPYLQIKPSSKGKFGRIWYGWKNFGQGGVNEKGLVIDGAVTPIQKIPRGYSSPKGNITDEILAKCQTVDEAIQYLEEKKVALKNAHIVLGDKKGKAVILEWINGVKKIIEIKNNRLIATNFNLFDSSKTEMNCWRYPIIQNGLDELDAMKDTLTIKDIGNVIAKVVQIPQKDSTGKIGGTLYTTFIDLTEMKLFLVYKLDNSKIQNLDILKELNRGKARKIKLK